MTFLENFAHDTLPAASCNTQLTLGALPCDAFHHFYHYQSSAQYVWLARACLALGLQGEAKEALKRAVFQDHFNAEALALQAGGSAGEVAQNYDKHPPRDAEFLASVQQSPGAATPLHDGAVALLQDDKITQALLLLDNAIALVPEHSNSHFARGKCYFSLGRHAEARANFAEAARLSHIAHDAYHRAASAEHMKRAQEFAARGELDLAINDYTKALDLHRGNTQATEERAKLQAMRD